MTTDYLDFDTEQKLQLHPNNLIGQRVAILGVSGSGKSNTTGVLIEEALDRNIPMTIVDLEGEYLSLKQDHPLVVVGHIPDDLDPDEDFPIDLELRLDQAQQLAELSFNRPVSLILDFSTFDMEQTEQFLVTYFQHLWKLIIRKRRPYMVVIEEASELIPQSGGNKALKSIITTLAKRGRKRGLTLVVTNQRATNIEKNILTQANMLFLHFVVYPNDIDVYKEITPMPKRDIEPAARGLQPGDAIFILNGKAQTIHVRLRHSFHSASTPGLSDSDSQPAHQVDQALLDELRAALGSTGNYRATLLRLSSIRNNNDLSVTGNFCIVCGKEIKGRRADAKFDSDACKQEHYRREKAKLN